MEMTIIVMLSVVIFLLLISIVCSVVTTITNFAKNAALLAMGQHLDKVIKTVREDIVSLNDNLDTINANQEEIYQRIQTVEARFNYILPGTRSSV